MNKPILAVALFFSVAASAQKIKNSENNYYNKPFHFGIKGGANLNKFEGQRFKQGFSFGFHAGAFAQVKLAHKIHLVGEVLFSQQNIDSADNIDEVFDFIRFAEERSKIRLNYIDVPVLLSVGIDQIGAIKLQSGVQASLLMNRSNTVLANGREAFKNGQLHAVAGVDWQLAAVKLGARYLWGLGSVNNVNSNSLKTQSIQVYLGLGF
jgi:hypothetical protein